MTYTTIKMTKELRRLTGSRKRQATVKETDKVTLSGGYWDGGSKDEYYAWDKGFTSLRPLSTTGAPQFDQREVPVVELTDDVVVVRMGWFCGKPVTPTFYVKSGTAAYWGLV